MKKVLVTVVALGAGLTLSLPGALARPHAGTTTQAVPGITSRAITIGGTFPFSGPVSSYAPIEAGMQTYFKYVNARRGPDGKRGVYGRGIIFKTYDDGYNPAQAVQLHNKLVLQDKVFAVVGTLGTENNRAIQPMLNAEKGPADPRLDWGELLGPGVQEVALDVGVADRLHRRGPHLCPLAPGEPAERADRGPVPERRLREGLPARV